MTIEKTTLDRVPIGGAFMCPRMTSADPLQVYEHLGNGHFAKWATDTTNPWNVDHMDRLTTVYVEEERYYPHPSQTLSAFI